MATHIRRREFMVALGGAVATCPLGARAQQADRMRRVGLLMGYPEGDPEGQANLTAFRQGLQKLGWTEGRNIRIDIRWGGADPNKARTFAKELVSMAPDVIVPNTNLMTAILQPETHTIPIVFVFVGDPVGSGYVASLARPGGNITGFSALDPAIGGSHARFAAAAADPGYQCVTGAFGRARCCGGARTRGAQGVAGDHCGRKR
jgi:putative ABC transport system substrate-binding protein